MYFRATGRRRRFYIAEETRTTLPLQILLGTDWEETGRVNRWDTHLTLKPLLMPAQRELHFALLRVHWLPWLLNA